MKFEYLILSRWFLYIKDPKPWIFNFSSFWKGHTFLKGRQPNGQTNKSIGFTNKRFISSEKWFDGSSNDMHILSSRAKLEYIKQQQNLLSCYILLKNFFLSDSKQVHKPSSLYRVVSNSLHLCRSTRTHLNIL